MDDEVARQVVRIVEGRRLANAVEFAEEHTGRCRYDEDDDEEFDAYVDEYLEGLR